MCLYAAALCQGLYSGLHCALSRGHLAAAQWLHAAGVELRRTEDGIQPIQFAMLAECSVDVLDWLVSVGQRVDAVDEVSLPFRLCRIVTQ